MSATLLEVANIGYLQLVRHCNQYCRFCSNPATGWMLDLDTAKRAVQRLREQGYVKITGEKVELPDVAALKKLYSLLGTKEELKGDAAGISRAR